MEAALTYIGRILALEPAELGGRFERACTVDLRVRQAGTFETGWKPSFIVSPQRNYWYDTHVGTGRRVFYAMSGYGSRIKRELEQAGILVREYELMPSGLPEPDFTRLRDIQLRPGQPEALAAMLACRTGTVVAPPGFGKSFLLRLLNRLYPTSKIVFTVPSRDIAREIYQALTPYESDIGFVGDGKHNPQRTTVAVSHSLMHCDPDANLLVGDEVHALMSPMFRDLLANFKRAKFIGLTASPEGRSDNGDGFVEALFGELVTEFSYQESVAAGNVVPIKVWSIEVAQGPNVSKITRDDERYRRGLWANEIRNRKVAEAVQMALQRYGTDAQVLIMVDKAEHAYRLQQLLPDFVVVTGETDADRVEKLRTDGTMQPWQQVCTAKDRARYKEEFSSGKLRRAIATFVWSKGVNFPDLQVLVRAEGTSSAIQSIQVTGRLSRLGSDGDKDHGLLIDFNDKFSPDLQNKSRARFKEYRKHGWEIEAP